MRISDRSSFTRGAALVHLILNQCLHGACSFPHDLCKRRFAYSVSDNLGKLLSDQTVDVNLGDAVAYATFQNLLGEPICPMQD